MKTLLLSILRIVNNLERFSGQWDGLNRLHAETKYLTFDRSVHLGASIPVPMRLRSRFDKLLKEAGLPHMRFHDLRHSAATILDDDVGRAAGGGVLGKDFYCLTALSALGATGAVGKNPGIARLFRSGVCRR